MPEPVLTLGTHALTAADPDVSRRRRLALPTSLVLHGSAALALVLVPLLATDPLPEPGTVVHAFFAEPMTAPAPPPPPPPPAPRASTAPQTPKVAPETPAFVAPVEVPTQIVPEAGLDLGVEGGVAGGVEGGVPGGVVGGVVGGLPDAVAAPPVQPVRVGGGVREPRKVVDVTPVYPHVAAQARIQGVVIIEATIDARGRVANTKVLRGVPVLDEAALDAVRQWVYTPTLLNGVPTPIIMTVTVTFRVS
jgi:protein TonB